ncbi:MAG: lysoplasmalogenase [Rhodobacteraceae bacterium]|nr:MAG: lysoplasmalogenase [Paracoccaceae bacterium]
MSPLLPLAAAFALAYLPLAARPVSKMRSVTKTLAVALLALAAVSVSVSGLLAAALALCALGDWLLSRDGDGAFMAGIGAFAAGHLAYVALFVTHPLADSARLLQAPQIWFVAGFALLGLAMAALLAPRAGALKGAVLGYIPVILGMGVAVLVLPGQGALGGALPAALAFVVSDLVLAFETFVLGKDHPLRRITPYLIWPLYWGAQAGFLMAFA